MKPFFFLLALAIVVASCATSKKSTSSGSTQIGDANDTKKKTEIESSSETNGKKLNEEKLTYLFQFDTSALLGDVLNRAQKEGKWVYLDIGAHWCAPCQIMKRDVYTNEETAAFFNQHFISYMVDVEKGEGPDLKLIFEVKTYPTLLFLDYRGRQMLRKETALTSSSLLNFGKEAQNSK